ncbi:MAG: hypothetical protein AAFY83_00485 [Pseudomonadota bacterium]
MTPNTENTPSPPTPPDDNRWDREATNQEAYEMGVADGFYRAAKIHGPFLLFIGLGCVAGAVVMGRPGLSKVNHDSPPTSTGLGGAA